MTPRARIADLDLVEQDGGLLIRDTRSNAEHSLHPLAAFVWKHADGRTTVPELAARASAALASEVTDDHVWAAVDVLTGARLLEERIAPPAGAQRVGRRDLLRNLAAGSVAAAAVGAVGAREAGAAAPEAGTKASAEQNQKASAESAEKRFDRMEEKLAARAAEQDTKFEARLAEENAAKASAEDRRKARDGFEDVVLDPLWASVGDPFAPAQFALRAGGVFLMGLIVQADPPQPDLEAAAGDQPKVLDDAKDGQKGVKRMMRIGTLPAACRPQHRLVFSAPSDSASGHTEVHITADGEILAAPGATEMSLSGISYPVPRGSRGPGDGDGDASAEERIKARAQQEQERKQQQAVEQRQKQAQEAQRKKAQEAEHKRAEEQRAKQKAVEEKEKAAAAQEREQKKKIAAEQRAKQQAKAQEQAAKQAQEQAAKQAG